jgi:hypothetical protein
LAQADKERLEVYVGLVRTARCYSTGRMRKEMNMPRILVQLAAPAIIGLAALGLIGLPALAQQTGKPPAVDVNRAKQMAALIEQGQLNLRDATAMAEKHVKGTALEVTCRIESAEPPSSPSPAPQPPTPPVEPGRPGAYSAQTAQPGGQRLIYDVSCFAKDRLQTVRVDGMTKHVIDALEQK